MESNEFNNDCFSSLIIEQPSFPSEIGNPIATQEINNEGIISRQKLKIRRKERDPLVSGSSMDVSRFKLIVKYGGFFKPINNGAKQKYCFGRQRTIYLDHSTYGCIELFEDLNGLYPSDENEKLLIVFLDKRVSTQSFVQIEDDEGYELMLSMYKEKKEVVIYVTKEKISICEDERIREYESMVEGLEVENGEINYEDHSDFCHSEASYHSLHSGTDDEDDAENDLAYDEFYSYDKDNPKMEVGAKFPDVETFRRALCHHAIINDFEFNAGKSDRTRVTATCAVLECSWRIHAAVTEDGVTFSVRTLKQKHVCCGINKRGNKHATQAWIADRVINDLRNEGEIPPIRLKKNLETKYGLLLPYSRVWAGKELAMDEIYGKWKDSFIQTGAFIEEIKNRNPGSIVELGTTPEEGENRHFERLFVSLGACINGFLRGCRPYISLDACHMKGKFTGIVAAATAFDGNNWMFPVAFAVMEGENESSWEWFLRALYKAIGMPNGLVISADMQKGLQNALAKVYPMAEHRECMRHLYKNFKNKFRGDLFKFAIWGAARTYSPTRFDAYILEIKEKCPAAIEYLNAEHNKLWSKSKFGTTSKCDSITNNIAETFNSWIIEERNKPVIDLLDSIRQKIMVKFEKRRRIASTLKGSLTPKVADDIRHISRTLHGYEVHRSIDYRGEIQKDGMRWEVNLRDHVCTCRAWQIKGTPCVHAVALIATYNNVRWDDYVDPYFTVARLRTTYSMAIAPMPSKNEWVKHDLGYRMLPPILKRPAGRPQKKRIRSSDEPKKRLYKCARCGLYGHNKRKCKNAVQTEGASHVEMT